MANMYDNLGEALNKILEDGKIPELKKRNSSNFDKQKSASSSVLSSDENTITIDDLPASTKKAFITLECLPSMSLTEVKKQYRELLKQNHPDTKDVPEIDVAIQDLVTAMEEVEKYYSASSSSPSLR